LDDFERKGNSLQDREVFGLISHLVEMKSCSVILILNQSVLAGDSEYASFNEKVFDYEVVYEPSVKESVGLVFNAEDENRKSIYHNCIKLGIDNIRILKKISMFAYMLDEHIKDSSDEIVKQAHRILPLAIYSLYGGKSAVVSIDFIEQQSGRIEDFMAARNNKTDAGDDAKALLEIKTNFLDSYGFTECDEFDTAIINLVKKGHTDAAAIKTQIEALAEQVRHGAEINLLKVAWIKFHASFAPNDKEVFDAFEKSIEVALNKFSISDLDSVAVVYYDVKKFDRINEVIDKYFLEVMPQSDIVSKSEIFRWPRHPYLQEKLNQYFASLITEKSFDEIMQEAYFASGLNGTELRHRLAGKTETEFYEYFRQLDIPHFSDYVNMCLECGRFASDEQQIQDSYNTIFLNTYRTLLKLSENSPLNQSRMHKFKSSEPVYEQLTAEIERRRKLSESPE
jgi:hypothetical protein